MKPRKCYAKGGPVAGIAVRISPVTIARVPKASRQPVPDMPNIPISSKPLAGPSLAGQTGRKRKAGF